MKTVILFLSFLCFNVCFLHTSAQTLDQYESDIDNITDGCLRISVPIVGKAGATVTSEGKVKLCPGWAWNICATVSVKLFNETTTNNFSSDDEMEIELYNETGQYIQTEFLQGKILVPNALVTTPYLTSDEVELE